MKNKITSVTFVGFLVMIFLFNVISPDKEISEIERRKLAQFPEFTINTFLNGSYMNKLNKYVDDQFIYREEFRYLKGTIIYDIFKTLDNRGIYIKNDEIYKIDYPTNQKSIQNFIQKINSIIEDFSPSNHIYYAVIPDKNYYLEEEFFLKIDYDYLYEEIKKINGNYIEFRDTLDLEDYYETDTHWRQERLDRVVHRLAKEMGLLPMSDYKLEEYNSFLGVLYNQSTKKRIPEKLYYLTNEVIESSSVFYLENKNSNKVYVKENLDSIDSYNIFLDGASSYIEITNPNNTSGKELVIFRDSFGSSLAPLLIENYSKITLIDLRYITKENYSQYITWNNQDILFLYSTTLVNSSEILK